MPPSAPLSSPDIRRATQARPTVQNIVATVDLQVRLDLKTIALHARNSEYKPRRFSAVILRIREPKTTALVFSSGKLVITGAKSEDFAKLAARKFARTIQKIGYQVQFTEFKIRNVVATCALGFCVRLEGLAIKHRQFADYEPELFPGLVYRMAGVHGVMLIFTSGRIVITGTKTREAADSMFDHMYPALAEFKKREGPERQKKSGGRG